MFIKEASKCFADFGTKVEQICTNCKHILGATFKPILTVNRASKSLNRVIKFWWLWQLSGAAMEAYELSKIINSIDLILLQDVSTIKTI